MGTAAKSFGKFKDSFLAELHAEISSHIKQEETGVAPEPVAGIIVHDSEVLEPDPVRAGGLMRKDVVRLSLPFPLPLRINRKENTDEDCIVGVI